MLGKEKLKELGEKGMIPGPNETEEEFVKRVDILQQRKTVSSGKTFEKWTPQFESVYGAAPDWLPLTYSNQGLLPWQGGVMWVFEEKGQGKLPLIQLRKGFKKGRFLFYSREEVLRHETVHALRLAFNEPKYEEILAYFHSPSRWRRLLGPLFRKPSQAIVFLSLILLSLGLQFASLFFLFSPFFPFLRALIFLPFADLAFRFSALIRDHRLLRKALRKISQIFPNQENPFPVALRLRDKEIDAFATESIEEILSYIKSVSSHSLRWKQILSQFSP